MLLGDKPHLRELINKSKHVHELIDIVRLVAYYAPSSDDIMDQVVSIFKCDIPDEQEMRHLSTMQQRFTATGGTEEYVTLTLFLCASMSIMEREGCIKIISDAVEYMKHRQIPLKCHTQRVKSCPCLVSYGEKRNVKKERMSCCSR